MTEEQLNENLIKSELQGICQDCIYLDKIVLIIRKMLSEEYKTGLEQSRFDKNMLERENRELNKENQELKQKLNWVAFGDDPELSLRYLRKIGYVDFDEERKVYINKHNNEPFLLKDEQEKSYYLKDEELNEYTTQLEYKIKELKKQLTKEDGLIKDLSFAVDDLEKHYKTHQKKFIEYLENEIKYWEEQEQQWIKLGFMKFGGEANNKIIFKKVLSKYKEIIGVKDE